MKGITDTVNMPSIYNSISKQITLMSLNDIAILLWHADLQLTTDYGTSPVETVTVRPVKIRAHHHIAVYTDSNETMVDF